MSCLNVHDVLLLLLWFRLQWWTILDWYSLTFKLMMLLICTDQTPPPPQGWKAAMTAHLTSAHISKLALLQRAVKHRAAVTQVSWSQPACKEKPGGHSTKSFSSYFKLSHSPPLHQQLRKSLNLTPCSGFMSHIMCLSSLTDPHRERIIHLN